MGLCGCNNQSIHPAGVGACCDGVSDRGSGASVGQELTDYSRREPFLVYVEGRPAPQGSKSYKGNQRFVEASKYLPAWRNAIVLAIKQQQESEQNIQKFTGPVRLVVTFFIERPKNPKWPYPATTPDLDKLVRGLSDSVTQAGLWTDDALVVELVANEVWTSSSTDSYPVPGARIYIEPK